MSKIRFVDVTLRDGNHTFRHQFRPELVRATAAALDEAGIDIIEVGHGDGLGGSCVHAGRMPVTDQELLRAAVEAVKTAQIAVLAVPGFCLFEDLEMAREVGVKVARIGTHVTEANTTRQHIEKAKQLGFMVVGYLISFGMAEPKRVAEEAYKMQQYGAEYINLAESQGHLTPMEVKETILRIRDQVTIPIGFHAHNNLGLGNANILAALEAGATYIDASLKGFGGGAGNAQTEAVIAVLKRAGYDVNADMIKTFEAATVFGDGVGNWPLPKIDNTTILMGYANVYGGMIHPIVMAAKEYGCSMSAIVMELSKRKIVAGQEDVVVEIAQELARKRIAEHDGVTEAA